MLHAALFIEMPPSVYGPVGFWDFFINEDGTLYSGPDGKSLIQVRLPDPPLPLEQQHGKINAGQHLLYPIMLTLCFMHCKNVTMTPHAPSRNEQRQYRRETGRSLFTYHTLEIDPMKKVLRSEGQIDSLGLKRALHITRGHFAEYGPEFNKGKLFGKLAGRYWIPQHVKGSAEFGEVKKDYMVKAPQGTEPQ